MARKRLTLPVKLIGQEADLPTAPPDKSLPLSSFEFRLVWGLPLPVQLLGPALTMEQYNAIVLSKQHEFLNDPLLYIARRLQPTVDNLLDISTDKVHPQTVAAAARLMDRAWGKATQLIKREDKITVVIKRPTAKSADKIVEGEVIK